MRIRMLITVLSGLALGVGVSCKKKENAEQPAAETPKEDTTATAAGKQPEAKPAEHQHGSGQGGGKGGGESKADGTKLGHEHGSQKGGGVGGGEKKAEGGKEGAGGHKHGSQKGGGQGGGEKKAEGGKDKTAKEAAKGEAKKEEGGW